MSTPFRAMISALAAMGPVVLREQTVTGEYLSALVAINPELPDEEAARTPQLVSELGRLTAAAYYEKEMAEVRYRVWRDTFMHAHTNMSKDDVKEALGIDGNVTKAAVELAMRAQADYPVLNEARLKAEETWQTLFAAYEAAKARSWAIRGFAGSGGVSQPAVRQTDHTEYSGPVDVRYDTGPTDEPLSDSEGYATGQRTPIPPPGRSAPPPPASEAPAPTKRLPPPPPPR